MKTLIISAGLLAIWLMFSNFQTENNKYIRFQEDVKYQVDELANVGAMSFEEEDYSKGFFVFKYNENINNIEQVLKLNLNLDASLTPKNNSFFSKKVNYYVYYFDDSKIARKYKNGALIETFSYDYGYEFTESLNGYKHKINNPSVVVTLDIGEPKFTNEFVKTSNLARTSIYEYFRRK